jgi:glycosyltransferase involved in cell wall biosynthesis
MLTNKLISVVIPVYNAEKYIRETIESILNQSYPYFELIIADDGSTDNSKKIIEGFNDNRIILSHNVKNVGKTETVNRLLKLCKGEYITIHDADDISLPNRFELLIKTFNEDKQLGMIGSWAEIISEDGKILIDIDKRPQNDQEIKNKIIQSSTFCGATVMIKREVYEKIGGYRTYFEHLGYQDYDWTYLISDSYKVYNIQQPLYKYRQVPQSRSKRVDAKRVISDKLVQFLAKQRRENNGIDCLMQGDEEPINNYMEELLVPYKNDPSLIYREFASGAMYNNMKKRAISLSWKSIQTKPLKLINWRTLFYCIRK